MRNLTIIGMAGALLVGCSNDSDRDPEPEVRLSFQPETLSWQGYSGDIEELTVETRYLGVLPEESFTIQVQDEDDVFSDDYTTQALDERTQLTLQLNPDLADGHYKGSLDIDTCADLYCIRKLGPTNTLNYDIEIWNEEPVYTLSLEGEVVLETNNYWRFEQVLGDNQPTYDLQVNLPGPADSVALPQELVNTYNIDQLDADRFTLQPPAYSTRVAYLGSYAEFSGPDYDQEFPLIASIELQYPNLPAVADEPTFARITGPDGGEATKPLPEFAPWFCDTAPTATLEPTTAVDWVTLNNQEDGCDIEAQFNATTTTYGVYEAEARISNDTQQYPTPLLMAYGQRELYSEPEIVPILASDTQPELTQRKTFTVNTDSPTLSVSSASSWIENVAIESQSNGTTTVGYNLNANRITALNPLAQHVYSGLVRIEDSANADADLVEVQLELRIPTVFRVWGNEAVADTPFELTINGENLEWLQSVQIYRVVRLTDAGGVVLQAVTSFAPTPEPAANDYNEMVIDMPGLPSGLYHLNFAGRFQDSIPMAPIFVE